MIIAYANAKTATHMTTYFIQLDSNFQNSVIFLYHKYIITIAHISNQICNKNLTMYVTYSNNVSRVITHDAN
ncbi:MAG: hypothetical protein WCG25_07625 [bacterium]